MLDGDEARISAHLIQSRTLPMKDVLFVVVTTAFYAVVWVYAKSFDHL